MKVWLFSLLFAVFGLGQTACVCATMAVERETTAVSPAPMSHAGHGQGAHETDLLATVPHLLHSGDHDQSHCDHGDAPALLASSWAPAFAAVTTGTTVAVGLPFAEPAPLSGPSPNVRPDRWRNRDGPFAATLVALKVKLLN